MKKTICAAAVMVAAVAGAFDHVGFLNVNGAVDAALFNETVTNRIRGTIQLATRTYAIDRIAVPDVVAAAAKGYPTGECKISVYFVDDPAFPPQVVAPGFFAIMNVRGLKKDADSRKYADRILKMVLKGLAFSCGFGANQDIGRCVMAAGSFDTLKGIDGTSASYSPFCYFPLSDYLRKRGLLRLPKRGADEE